MAVEKEQRSVLAAVNKRGEGDCGRERGWDEAALSHRLWLILTRPIRFT